jgi:hypothetical protein
MFDEKETPEQRIEKIDGWITRLQKDRAETVAKLPSGGGPAAGGMQTITDRIAEEDRLATAFDRLSGPELLDLYKNNKPGWESLLRAKEAAGIRRLMEGRGR